MKIHLYLIELFKSEEYWENEDSPGAREENLYVVLTSLEGRTLNK